MKRFEFQNPFEQQGKAAVPSTAGFTLIEMVTTVFILGLLTTFSVGPIGKQIAKARQAEAKTTLGQAQTMQSVYAIQNNGYANIASYGGMITTAGSCSTGCTLAATGTAKEKCTNGTGTCNWTAASTTPNATCTTNDLELRILGCDKLRYSYTIVGDKVGFMTYAEQPAEDLIFGCEPTGSITAPVAADTKGSFTPPSPTATPLHDAWFNSEIKGITAVFDVTASGNCT